jgi:hypothetical protein
MRFRSLQRPYDRLRHIFHIGRLQSRQAAAEHRIDWKSAEELDDGREKCVIRSEHHRRADENCVGERRPNRQFAFTALSDVWGLRGSISADSRNVGEPFDSGSVRLSCYPLGRLNVHEMKSLLSVLEVKTDCIYHAVSAGKCVGDWPFVVNVGRDRMKLRIITTEQSVAPIRMS